MLLSFLSSSSCLPKGETFSLHSARLCFLFPYLAGLCSISILRDSSSILHAFAATSIPVFPNLTGRRSSYASLRTHSWYSIHCICELLLSFVDHIVPSASRSYCTQSPNLAVLVLFCTSVNHSIVIRDLISIS